MGFKERMGIVEPRRVIQLDALDDETRVALWNSIHLLVEKIDDSRGYGMPDKIVATTGYVWRNHFKRPMDEYRSRGQVLGVMKDVILGATWDDVLELIEDFGAALGAAFAEAGPPKAYQDRLNERFSSYLIGYRFVAGQIVAVADDHETSTIEAVVEAGGTPAIHLKRALELLSNRERPQYAKVVHESISAVESKVADLTGKKVLSDGLKDLEKKGFPTHPALKDGWTKLYGYSSDAGGIRHGLVRDEEIDEALAVYFLVSCSAFVNFLTKIQSAPASSA